MKENDDFCEVRRPVFGGVGEFLAAEEAGIGCLAEVGIGSSRTAGRRRPRSYRGTRFYPAMACRGRTRVMATAWSQRRRARELWDDIVIGGHVITEKARHRAADCGPNSLRGQAEQVKALCARRRSRRVRLLWTRQDERSQGITTTPPESSSTRTAIHKSTRRSHRVLKNRQRSGAAEGRASVIDAHEGIQENTAARI